MKRPKRTHKTPKLKGKNSIVSIVLRDLARTYRGIYPSIRIEAHPININLLQQSRFLFEPKFNNFANLYVTVNHSYKLVVMLAARDENLTAITKWTIDGNTCDVVSYGLVIVSGESGLLLHELSTEQLLEVSILDPNSLDELGEWINKRIAALIVYVNTVNNNRPTQT